MKAVPTLMTKCLMKIGVRSFVNKEIDEEDQEIISRNIVPQVLRSNFPTSYKKLWCAFKTKDPKDGILDCAKLLFNKFKRQCRKGRMERRTRNLMIITDGIFERRVKHIKELRKLKANEWVGIVPETDDEKFIRKVKKN